MNEKNQFTGWVKLSKFLMLSGLLALLLGGYFLKDQLKAHEIFIFKKSALFQIIMSFSIFLIANKAYRLENITKINRTLSFMMFAIVLYCIGSYLFAMTQSKGFHLIALIGTLCFIGGGGYFIFSNKSNKNLKR